MPPAGYWPKPKTRPMTWSIVATELKRDLGNHAEVGTLGLEACGIGFRVLSNPIRGGATCPTSRRVRNQSDSAGSPGRPRMKGDREASSMDQRCIRGTSSKAWQYSTGCEQATRSAARCPVSASLPNTRPIGLGQPRATAPAETAPRGR